MVLNWRFTPVVWQQLLLFFRLPSGLSSACCCSEDWYLLGEKHLFNKKAFQGNAHFQGAQAFSYLLCEPLHINFKHIQLKQKKEPLGHFKRPQFPLTTPFNVAFTAQRWLKLSSPVPLLTVGSPVVAVAQNWYPRLILTHLHNIWQKWVDIFDIIPQVHPY